MNTNWRTAAACLAAGLMMMGCAHAPVGAPNMQRATTFGAVVGNDDAAASGTWSWKGVPFAAPPVGALRWRAPVDPQPWTQPRDATRFASACVQTGRLYGPGLHNRYDETIGQTLGKTLGSEDCLYLNVWTPASVPAQLRPVIVWVHGGSNITGYTADPVYDGAHLARTADAVVVSVPYRLGIFGFLDAPVLKTGDAAGDSGNFALLDILQALRFVQRDIAAFGGDPRKVTLMGESSGAVNVYALLASPMVAAMQPAPFQRLVALSGGISSAATLPPGAFSVVRPLAGWRRQGDALLAQSLVADGLAADTGAAQAYIAAHTPQQLAAWLRGRSADALLATVHTRLARMGLAASNPIPDGHVLPADPIAGIRAGRYVHVPVLAGNTRDEAKLFPSLLALRPSLGGKSGRLLDDAAVFKLAAHYDPDGPPATRIEDWIPPQYLPVDAPGTGYDARTEALDRIWFLAYRDDVLDALKSRQPAVWYYRFDWDELPAPFDAIYGAAHTFDLPFVFGNFGPSLHANIMFSRANAPGRLALSRAMMASVAAFARSGDPNTPALGTRWEPWPARLLFDADRRQARISSR
jgi:para-nitrobenzyl esterase